MLFSVVLQSRVYIPQTSDDDKAAKLEKIVRELSLAGAPKFTSHVTAQN